MLGFNYKMINLHRLILQNSVTGGYLQYYHNFQKEHGAVAVYISKTPLMDIGPPVALIL